MFARTHLIFSLTPTALSVARVQRDGQALVAAADFELGNSGLAGSFERAKKQFGQGARLIVPEEYVYTTRLEVQAKNPGLRSNIEKEITQIFPETLGDVAWDYQVITTSNEGIAVEVSGMMSDFSHVLKTALHTAHYRLEAIIPESYALAQLVPGHEVTLIVHECSSGWILALAKDQWVATALFQPNLPTVTDLQNVIDFGKERKHLTVSRVVFSVQKTLPEKLPQLTTLSQTILDVPLDATFGAAKISLGRSDDQRLDLPLRGAYQSWWQHWFK